LDPNDQVAATNLLEKQMIGYTYVSLRSIGDQPGVSYPRYLAPLANLAAGRLHSLEKFTYNDPRQGNPAPVLTIRTNGLVAYRVYGFNTNNIFRFLWSRQLLL